MNRSEISEIRRRFNPEKNQILCVRGCYVNEKKEVVSTFCRPLAAFALEEGEKYAALLRRTLSGVPGKNLVDVVFSNQEVMEGESHGLLMRLRNSQLKDEALVEQLYRKIIDSLQIEDHYLILLIFDAYDVPYRAKDGLKVEDSSEEVFPYLMCSICPVKLSKAALSYNSYDKEFHSKSEDWIVAAPEIGFLFPAFDERSSNIYNALYYTKDTAFMHDEFAEAIFNTPLPMAAQVQKETFHALLHETLAEDCNLEVMQAVQDQVMDQLEAHKADKHSERPVISIPEMKEVLESCGVKQERITAFAEKFDEEFGRGVALGAQNIVNDKKFEVRTPDVVIQVNPSRSDLVETKMINGLKYILIRADEGVEINGVDIAIK